MSPTPEISICLTSYNRGCQISKTLDSLLAQDFSDFELLIQDDCSSDNTEEVCRTYERRDSRVRFVRNPTNLGMPGNLNAVVARARGDFVANLHDGDIYRADLLRRWRQSLQETGGAFVFNALQFVDHDGTDRGTDVHPFGPRIERGALVAYMLERFCSPVWGTVMARRRCYEELGYFDPEYSFIADVEMWMRMNLSHPVAYVPEPLIQLTPHEPDRPYASVNWDLERAAVTMRHRTAERYFDGDSKALRAYLARFGRVQDRRWLFLAASCVKMGEWRKVFEASKLFRCSSRRVLRTAGLALVPLTWLWK